MRSHLIGRIANPQQPIAPLVRRTIAHEPREMALGLAVANGKAAELLVRAGLAALRYRFADRGASRISKNSF